MKILALLSVVIAQRGQIVGRGGDRLRVELPGCQGGVVGVNSETGSADKLVDFVVLGGG